MATFEINRPFRTVPSTPQDFERFFREDLSVQVGTVVADDIGDDAVSTTKIVDKNVTLAKIADLTADRILGRLSTSGAPEELTAAQVVALLQAVTWVFAQSVRFDGNIGFFGTTPVGQQSDPGAPSLATISGSGDDANINANFAALETAINGLRTTLNNLGAQA